MIKLDIHENENKTDPSFTYFEFFTYFEGWY